MWLQNLTIKKKFVQLVQLPTNQPSTQDSQDDSYQIISFFQKSESGLASVIPLENVFLLQKISHCPATEGRI